MYVDSDCGAFGSPPKYSCGPPNKMLRIFGQLGIRKLKYLGAAMVCVSPAPTQLPLDPRSHIFLFKNTPTMKSVIFAAAIASAAAFAPAPVAKTTSSLNAFESELGAQPPLGFYDPLGFLDGADQERFDRLRYVELKHGRTRATRVAFVPPRQFFEAKEYVMPGLGWRNTRLISLPKTLNSHYTYMMSTAVQNELVSYVPWMILTEL